VKQHIYDKSKVQNVECKVQKLYSLSPDRRTTQRGHTTLHPSTLANFIN
jgi:hypothetical protein